ncbi:hypothetical protein [Candidatus Symbiopectobacterium sp.]|uniref:hypothetical protein n=1 Tax=Candidatus Symbiopectobacterium sp. TaxID=2816440 RepID=UPI00345DC392
MLLSGMSLLMNDIAPISTLLPIDKLFEIIQEPAPMVTLSPITILATPSTGFLPPPMPIVVFCLMRKLMPALMHLFITMP